jgi:hypothetical protein
VASPLAHSLSLKDARCCRALAERRHRAKVDPGSMVGGQESPPRHPEPAAPKSRERARKQKNTCKKAKTETTRNWPKMRTFNRGPGPFALADIKPAPVGQLVSRLPPVGEFVSFSRAACRRRSPAKCSSGGRRERAPPPASKVAKGVGRPVVEWVTAQAFLTTQLAGCSSPTP